MLLIYVYSKKNYDYSNHMAIDGDLPGPLSKYRTHSRNNLNTKRNYNENTMEL